MVSYNIFTVQDQGDNGWAHGRLYATGVASAAADFGRGIDLSASIDLEAALDGEVANGLYAGLSAGGTASAGLGLTAAFPLDLFKQAGIVARFRAQAAAAAYLRAEIGLEAEEFIAMLDEQMSGTWLELMRIFLDEVRLGAGLWGNASVSAQVLAEAAIVGNLVASAGMEPGFTCSFKYAAGWGAGAGMDYRVNFGIKNPHRLFDRLADQLTVILEREAQTWIETLPDGQRDVAQEALPLLRFVLPLAFRASFEQGVALAQPAIDYRSVGAASLARSVIQEAQEVLSRALLDLAFDTLDELLNGDAVLDAIGALDDAESEEMQQVLETARAAVEKLVELEPSAEEWLGVILDGLDGIAAMSLLIPAGDDGRWKDALALGWAAGVLIRQLIGWTASSDGSSGPINASLVTIPSSGVITSHIATTLNKQPGAGLTAIDAVEYILLGQNEYLQFLSDAFPQLRPLIALLTQIFQGESTRTILEVLYKDAASEGAINPATLLPRLIQALQPAVERQVVSRLLDPMEQSADAALAEIIRCIIKPAVLSVTRVILAGVSTVDTEQRARIIREQISSVLLLSLARFITISTEILADRAATDSIPALRGLADDIRAGNADVAASLLLSQLMLPSPITPNFTPAAEDLAELVDLAAETIQYWNDNERSEWIALLESMITLGLSTGETDLDQLWSTLENEPDAPPVSTQLEQLALRLRDSTLGLLQWLAQRLYEIVVRFFERWAAAAREAIETAIETAVAAVRQAADWLDRQVAELEQIFKRLAEEIEQAITSIANAVKELATKMAQQVEGAISDVQTWGWNAVNAALFNNPVFWALPDWAEDPVKQTVRSLYDGFFDTVKYLLTAPLQAFALVADWVLNAVGQQMHARAFDRDAVLKDVRAKAASLTAMPLSFPIKFDVVLKDPIVGVTMNLGTIDLGTVHLGSSNILGVIVNKLMSSPFLGETVDSAISNYGAILEKSQQLSTTEAALSGALDKDEANNALDGMFPEQPLEVRIDTPAESSTHAGTAGLRVRVSGANRTFVTNTLGVPTRIKVFVNGQEHQYAAANWSEQDQILVYRATIAATTVGLAPIGIMPEVRYVEVDLPQGITLTQTKAADGIRRLSATSIDRSVVEPLTPDQPIRRLSPDMVVRPARVEPASVQPLFRRPQEASSLLSTSLLGSITSHDSASDVVQSVVVQPTGTFHATPSERVSGYRWVAVDQLTEADSLEIGETIIARPGLNWIEVVAVDGSGRASRAGRSFYLQA